MLGESLEDLLTSIKKRCYISATIFDEEISSLIQSCILDCIESGVNKKAFEKDEQGKFDNLILNCITNYVKAHRGNDRTDTEQYMKMYLSIRNKLTLLKDYNTGGANE